MSLLINPAMLDDETATEDDSGRLPDGVYTEDQEIPADRTELFRVNSRVYTVAKQMDPQLVFRTLRRIRKTRGRATELDELSIMTDMLYDALGEPVMDALADEKLSSDEIQQVMKAAQKYTTAVAQKTLGNS